MEFTAVGAVCAGISGGGKVPFRRRIAGLPTAAVAGRAKPRPAPKQRERVVLLTVFVCRESIRI